jgi:branched-subunit amino acid transport protein
MEVFLIIIGMSIVTYVPRLLPALIMDRFMLPTWVNRWLKSIPYAALGALIFPGILSVDKSSAMIGLVGGLVAAAAAYFRVPIIYVIFGSIVSVILMKVWFAF